MSILVLSTRKYPTTESGLALLDDFTTSTDWWDQRDDLPTADLTEADARLHLKVERLLGSPVILADLDADMPASEELREPDMYDEGRAIWLTDMAVVSVDVTRVAEVKTILAAAERMREVREPNKTGWVRIHPSHYGVEVDSFHEHDGTLATHPAHQAWTLLAAAVA